MLRGGGCWFLKDSSKQPISPFGTGKKNMEAHEYKITVDTLPGSPQQGVYSSLGKTLILNVNLFKLVVN